MAQDNRNPQQNQQSQQAQRPPLMADSGDFASFFYAKDNAPSDLAPPVRALLVRGWKCAADNPRLERGEWYPPEASDTATMTEEPLKGWVMEPNPNKSDGEGNLSEPVEKQLMMQDGTEFGRLTIPIKRTTIRPPTRPITFAEAVHCERNKDLQARREQTQKKAAVA